MKVSLPKFQLVLVSSLAAFSAGVVVLTYWALTPSFYFEVSMRSSTGGIAQTFYDVGRGISESDSVRLYLHDAKSTAVYRFPLPEAEYRTIRFDPLDHGNANLVIKYARIVDMFGHTVRRFSLRELAVANGISASEMKDGKMWLTLGSKDNDSILIINPGTPLTLHIAPSARLLFALRVFLLFFLPLVAAGLLWLIFARRIWSQRMQQRWSRCAAWIQLHPGRALLIVATISTVVSCYPVVFFGKSFVSPNNGAGGVLLLYDRLPTLPGYTSSTQDDAKGADLGAAAWFHVPYSVVESRAIFHDFELPLWNRYDSCGLSLLGQGQSMFGDPLHFIVLLARGSSWAWDIKFLLAKMLFAWGMGLTIYAATRHLPASLILTASSVFIGFFAFRYDHAAIFSVCYSPWILYCWFRIREVTAIKQALPWVVGLMVACWAEMNSGTVKEAYMLLLGMNGCGLLVVLLSKEPISVKLKKLIHLMWAGLLFMAISMPIWLTFLDALRSAYTQSKNPSVGNIPPSLFIGFFDDIFYREFTRGEGVSDPSTNFLVLLGFLFALGHFKDLLRDSAYRAVGISAIVGFAMAFAIVPPSVIVKIPFIGNIHHIDSTFSCVLIVYLILMAGFGLRAFWLHLPAKAWQASATASFLFLALLLSLYLGFIQMSSPEFPSLRAHEISWSTFFDWYASTLLVAVVALPFIARGIVQSARSRILTVPLLVASLFILHWRHGMHLKTPVDAYVMNPQVRVNFAAKSSAIDFIQQNQTEPSRVVGLGDNLFPGFNAALGIDGIDGADPLVNPYYRQLMSAWGIETPKGWGWRWIIRGQTLAHVKPLCDLLNVRYFLGSSKEQPEPALRLVGEFDLAVYENNSVWPRAFFVDHISAYDSLSQFISMVVGSEGHPFAAIERADLERNPSLAPLVTEQTGSQVVAAKDYRFTTNSTSFKVVAPRPGVIVLTEAYVPKDFCVTLNGKSVPYFRVNHVFKGIMIERPGNYELSFRYWPSHFTLSLWVSAIGLGLLICYISVCRKITAEARQEMIP
jgi:hypothetical protein